jgi:hypothetical protein
LAEEIAMALLESVDVLRRSVDSSTETLKKITLELNREIEGLTERMAASEKHLAQRIDASTTTTDTQTRQLARLTKAMAWATIVLAVFAVAQVAVAVIAVIRGA